MPTGKPASESPPSPAVVCASCGSNMDGLDPALAACPDCGHPRGAARPQFCKGCRYDLAGIDGAPAICPECGREFDPDDPATTMRAPRSTLISEARKRYSLPLAVILLIITGLVYNIIPRPATFNDWRLWVWMDRKYGVEATWISGHPGRIDWWAHRITGVHAVDPSGAPLWDITWEWPDRWSLRAHRAGVDSRDLSAAFTNMKREMFGVFIGATSKEATDGPLELEGTKVDIFSGLVKYFGIEVSPFLLRADQPYVWLFDRELGRMVAVDREKAAAMGYEVRLWRDTERTDPLIEPPAGRSPSFQQPPRVPSE